MYVRFDLKLVNFQIPGYPYWTFLLARVFKYFDHYNIFVLINVCLLGLIKNINMDILVKMNRFQIKHNVLNVKSTLAKINIRQYGLPDELDTDSMPVKGLPELEWIQVE